MKIPIQAADFRPRHFLLESFLRRLSRYLLLALACLSISSLPVCFAQQTAQTPDLAGIAHVAIRVSDLLKSRAFYEKLGFEEAFAMDKGGTPTEAFLKINDRQFIELYPQRGAAQPVGFLHVCFESNDLDGLNRYYLAQSLTPKAVRRAGAGNLLFTMEGPEQQNIEYTQYMPGSRHWNDRGNHLGPHRITQQILAAGLVMQNAEAARAFYLNKLAFTPTKPIVHGEIGVKLPGDSGEQIEIYPRSSQSAFELFFAVPNLRETAAQLKTLGIPAERHRKTLSIHDPDGNLLIFVASSE
jgi:catechol 2,3-dioxygenase-like lactoylglutathione lyase family enzyme